MNPTPLLSPTEHRTARATLRAVALFHRTDADLAAELNERLNLAARYESLLADDDFTDDAEAERLRGGVSYEVSEASRLAAEIHRRERAERYGYRFDRRPARRRTRRSLRAAAEGGLEPLADLIGELTGQFGVTRSGSRHFKCPFHNGGQERTASLVVFADGHAHCFACGWHGDGAAFVAELRGISQTEALLLLEKEFV